MSHLLAVLVLQNISEVLFCVSLEGEPGAYSKLCYCFLTASPCLHIPLPSQISGLFPGGSDGKASAYNVGDLGSIPGIGKPHGQRSLVGYRPRGRKESDTAEQLHFHFLQISKCLSLPTGTQGRSGGLNEAYFLQKKKKKRDTERLLPRKSPTGS